jgi:hypothetical protein
MDQSALASLQTFLDTSRADIVDARSVGGEVIRIPLLNQMMRQQALAVLADNLSAFMEQVTGRGYRKAEEVYDLGFTVREPGHQAYGLKVSVEEGCAIISRVAILEDDTVFQRYVQYLHTGLVI